MFPSGALGPREQAARLLEAVTGSGRRFDAIIVGESERAGDVADLPAARALDRDGAGTSANGYQLDVVKAR
jgi:hypothetical protein